MSKELRWLALFASGLLVARILVIAIDSVAEAMERRSLYR